MPLLYCLITITLAWLMSGALTPLAKKYGLTSRRNPRRLEDEGKPLIGGIAIYLSVVSTAIFFGFPQTLHLLVISLPLLGIGIIDDLRELKARHKLPIQIAVSAAWLLSYNSHEWLLVHLGVDPTIAFVATLFWMVGIINAVNLTDGVDGVAGGLSFIALTLLAFFLHLPQPLFFAVAASATLGFLLKNWHPAKIYLGDAGSNLLGFWIAAGYSILKLPATFDIHILIPLLVLAYPEFDTVFAMGRRLKEGRPIFTGDRRHIHHMLVDLGISTRGVASTIIAVTALLAFSAYNLGVQDDQSSRVLAIFTIGSLIGLFIFVARLHRAWNLRTQRLGLYLFKTQFESYSSQSNNTNLRFGLELPLIPVFSHIYSPEPTRLTQLSKDLVETLSGLVPFSQLVMIDDKVYILLENPLDEDGIYKLTLKISQCLDRQFVELWPAQNLKQANDVSFQRALEVARPKTLAQALEKSA